LGQSTPESYFELMKQSKSYQKKQTKKKTRENNVQHCGKMTRLRNHVLSETEKGADS